MQFRFRLAKTKVWERKFWNLSTKVEKIMPTPNLGLWRSAREPEVWEMWLFTVKLHQYAIKVTENFTMSSLKIPFLKNIPRLHVNVFYSSKEVFTCEFWSAFATSAVSLVGFKASWNLFLLEWKCGFRKGVSLKEQDVVTHRLYPTRACPAGNYDIFLPSRAQRWTANNFFFFRQKAFVFYDVKRVLWDRIMAISDYRIVVNNLLRQIPFFYKK